jgi:hypothetical protein
MVTAREAAQRLMIAERHFFRLVADGVLPDRGTAGWDLDACLRRFLDYQVALCLVRGLEPAALGIDTTRAIRVLRWLAQLRGVPPEELGLSADATPWEL